VTIPSRYIVGIERKRVQVKRSLLIAGAMIGGAIWIAAQGTGMSRRVRPATLRLAGSEQKKTRSSERVLISVP
jgi:hypothetical protein